MTNSRRLLACGPMSETDPMSRAADEACILVARHYGLRPEDVRDGEGRAAKHARWIAWRILRDVTGWEVPDIAETFGVCRSAPHYGLAELDGKINGRRADKKLRERVEACLREAAGGT